jgi:TonB family protein
MQRVRGRLAFSCVPALLMLAPFALGQPQPQTNVEEPTAEYRATMTSMADILFRPSDARLAEEAAELRTKLATVESFWTTRNAADAVGFAKAAAKAASDLESAANAKDSAAVASARTELTASCLGCHKTHVGRAANDSLVIAIQPSTQPSTPASGGGAAGGGVQRPGKDVTYPTIVRQVKPAYTANAMRMKAQGEVFLECVVLPDGSVSNIRDSRSLDPVFGLDDEAVKAARQWRFNPGMRGGEPVAVMVVIEMTFTLR